MKGMGMQSVNGKERRKWSGTDQAELFFLSEVCKTEAMIPLYTWQRASESLYVYRFPFAILSLSLTNIHEYL